jgi:hypothetical protein
MLMPLNGTKTHRLRHASRDALIRLLDAPMPKQELNPGVVDRLTRGNPHEWLARIVGLPSPYKWNSGATIAFLEITDAGKAALKE